MRETKIKKYNGRKNWSFTEIEIKFVQDNQDKSSVSEMAKAMGRSIPQLRGHMRRTALVKLNSASNIATEEEVVELWNPDEMYCWLTGEVNSCRK